MFTKIHQSSVKVQGFWVLIISTTNHWWLPSCFQRRPPKAQGNSWGGLPHWCNTWRLWRPVFFPNGCDVNKRCFVLYGENKHVVESRKLDFKQQHSEMTVQTYRKGSPFYDLPSSNLISCRSTGSRKARWFLVGKQKPSWTLYELSTA